MKKWGLLLLLCSTGWAEQCSITSPLPVPVLLSGCTYSGSLPSNSTSYIQNTLTPTTTSQAYSVANATVTTQLNVGYLTPNQPVQTDTNSNLTAGPIYAGNINGLIASTTSLQSQFANQISPSTGIIAGALPNTVIASSISAQQFMNIAGLYLSTITVLGNHTISSTDTVVFASSTLTTGVGVTYALPLSANSFNNGSGQVIQITKVDASTGPVKIQTQGGNLIDGTTGLLTLNAIGQTDELVADGNNGWWPHGQGIQITPSFLGLAQEGGSSAIMSASSDTVVCPFFVNVPVAVTGFRTFSITCTGASQGFSNFAVYDQGGNLRVSSSSVVCPGAAAWQVTLTTPVNLSPGQYYVGLQIDNATTNVGGLGPNGGNGATTCSRQTSTTGILPNPFIFGTTDLKAPAVFVQVAGGKTGI